MSAPVSRSLRMNRAADDRSTSVGWEDGQRPAAPLVRDEEAAVPAACPIGRSTREITVTPGQPDT